MQDGRIVDTGKPGEIEKTSKPFKDLIAAE
jgi:hypothetical protein